MATAASSSDLLERSAEVERLGAALDDARTGSGRVVLVAAEAGGGKTALIRRFCAEQPGRVLWGACDPLFTPRPLGPLLAVGEDAGGEVEHVIAQGGTQHDVASALARELDARPGTVLVLDDLHWADEATLDVLRLLVRRVESLHALVIGTYRDDELEAKHPLRRVLGELATSDAVERQRLAPLSLDAVAELCGPHGVDPVDLHRKTAGNPFFVAEALAAGGDEVPETVKDAVLARAGRLGDDARSLLDAVSVIPQRAELWLLEAMAGDGVNAVDECIESGMLVAGGAAVGFRHELARLAVESSIPLTRLVSLHRQALLALGEPPAGEPDAARLAHHAEGAGDREAVLRHAPAAAERAAALGAHREAAAQYARAIRFGESLTLAERAELLELQTHECFVTDQYDEGIAAIAEAAECRRRLGDRRRQGLDIRIMSEFLWCPGRVEESERAAREAVAILEALPPGRELGTAYANLSHIASAGSRSAEGLRWANRALELAVRFEDLETAAYAAGRVAINTGDYDMLLDIADRAEKAGLGKEVAESRVLLVGMAVGQRKHEIAERHIELGLRFCEERGLALYRLYLQAFRARLELERDRWPEAAEAAALVLRIPRTSTSPRIGALTVLALVRARRGDPDVTPLLDEAWELARPTGELFRFGQVAAARAEVAWLAGDADGVVAATNETYEIAQQLGERWLTGELAAWRARSGLVEPPPDGVATPYALELAGDHARAARAWNDLPCGYQAALAGMGAREEDMQRSALAAFRDLGARPAASIVARRLRDSGVRGVPRGPRPETRNNPASLTSREVEVLTLMADGLRNSEIAGRLFLSVKTVDHHVSAILRKLGVRSRSEASIAAVTQGLLGADR